IFEEIHSEVKDLNYELNQLQEIYQSKYNSNDNKSDNEEDNYQRSILASDNLPLDDTDYELDDYFTL
ncbi:37682_t:CDS:1, partial [Gigaspora margarita]